MREDETRFEFGHLNTKDAVHEKFFRQGGPAFSRCAPNAG